MPPSQETNVEESENQDGHLARLLATFFLDKYIEGGTPTDLENAIEGGLASVALSPEDSTDYAGAHETLGISYFMKYQSGRAADDLEAALRHNLSAVAGTPEGDSDLASRRGNLAMSYGERYKRTGDLDDLNAALKWNLSAVAETPEGDPDQAARQQSLALCYTLRHRKTGNLDDLEASLQHNILAVAATPEDDPDLAARQQNLGVSYSGRYGQTGDLGDLEAALRHKLLAVVATPEDHPELAARQKNLGVSYADRYQKTRDLEDLEAALKYKLLAVAGTPKGHPDLAERQQILAASYTDRYQRTGDLEDAEAALKYSLSAVAATPEGHSELAGRQQHLGMSYADKYQRTGALEDLEAAIKHNLLAVATTPEGDPDLAARQQNLGVTYADRYQRIGNIEDLEAALKCKNLAVAATPKGHPHLAARQQNLGVSYTDRYHRTGDLADLEASLKYKLSALDITPKDHPDLAYRQQNLAVSYADRYERTGNLQDLEAALQCNLSSVAETPEGHPDLASRQQNLGVSYTDRYRKVGNFEDLEASLKYKSLAVAATPEDHPELAVRQKNLGVSYADRYRRTWDLGDLEAALKYKLLAVVATPEGHPDLAGRQQILAVSYIDRYIRTKNTADLEQANTLYKNAMKSSSALPHGILQISTLYTSSQLPFPVQDVIEAYQIAFQILPLVLWLGSSLSTRHDNLIRHDVSTMTSRAVAFALQHSKTTLAIEFFEQALSVTHKQKLQLRDDSTLLKTQHPVLSQELHQISFQLQSSSSRSDPNVNYHILANTRNTLLQKIRSQPGFEHFLLAPQYSYLTSAAMYGPVVMLNISEIGKAAAIIMLSPSASPVLLPLSTISESVVTDYKEKIRISLQHFFIHSREIRYGRPHKINNTSHDQPLQAVITWIWTAIVEPVFSVLKNNGINTGRLWWCPSGPFTYFPLHAAAPADSQFIQSYTPTLESLIQANRKNISLDDALTLVGISQTSENVGTWLPAVQKEIDNIASLFGSKAQQLMNSQATVQAVLEKIQASSWLHLACHGHQDLANPLNSHLLLYDGQIDLQSILDINIPSAKFVYLSACETAMGDSKLLNEAMHLAGGFLAAGFQGAIGTMWSMPDAYGPEVAHIVYKTILGEDNVPDIRRAAEGLQLAIQKLRAKNVPLHQWMPFIHLGI